MRGAWAEINLKAIEHNYNIIRGFIGSEVKFVPVLKRNAYGHGDIRIAKKLLQIGDIEMIAVSMVDEAVDFRKSGISIPILLITDINESQCEEVIKNKLVPMIYSIDIVEKLNSVAQKYNTVAEVHIRVDTTHGSPGIEASRFDEICNEIAKLNNIKIVGVFTQLYAGYGENSVKLRTQLDEFNVVLDYIKENNMDIKYIHAASTPTIFSSKETHFNMVRCGAALYGLPFDNKYDKELKQVLSIKAKIIHVKNILKDGNVGYEKGKEIKESTKLATVPIGYADCMFLIGQKCGEVLINGERAPVFGKPCMDQIFVDVTNVKNTKVGDEVVILGHQGSDCIDIKEIMNKVGLSISNCETLCFTGDRLPKIYVE